MSHRREEGEEKEEEREERREWELGTEEEGEKAGRLIVTPPPAAT